MQRFVGGSLTLLIGCLVVNAAYAATPLSRCEGMTCYYQVREGLVYQGQALIRFGTAQQAAALIHPVALTIQVGPKTYRFVYKITDNVTEDN